MWDTETRQPYAVAGLRNQYGTDSPTSIFARYVSTADLALVLGTIAICNEDVTSPLLVGFRQVSTDPRDWYVQIGFSDQSGLIATSTPPIPRTIPPPGGSDTYRLSLRFGDASAREF